MPAKKQGKIIVDVIGETPKDRKHIEKLLGNKGKITKMTNHPTLGDYGATLFKIEFTKLSDAKKFEKLFQRLGFMV